MINRQIVQLETKLYLLIKNNKNNYNSKMGGDSESNDDTCAVGLGCALEAFTEVDEVKGIIICF